VAAIHEWGLQAVLVHDGVEAMLTIQRLLPRAVVLDAALPKMYGFQVCEVVKRNDSLRDTRVALVGAIHQRDRYRRPPSQLYGADVYLERPDLPDGLKPILVQAGFPIDGHPAAQVASPSAVPEASAPAAASAAEAPTPAAVSQLVPATETVAPAATSAEADDGLGAEREKAERLARIIVSDIVLYNAEKFDAAAVSGNVVEALEGDLAESRTLFEQRIDPRIREERDYLLDELRRVAAERGN
jgi:CheY-like chemotaxis protein